MSTEEIFIESVFYAFNILMFVYHIVLVASLLQARCNWCLRAESSISCLALGALETTCVRSTAFSDLYNISFLLMHIYVYSSNLSMLYLWDKVGFKYPTSCIEWQPM